MGPGTVVTGPGVVAVVPAKDEEERVGATVEALHRVPGVRHMSVITGVVSARELGYDRGRSAMSTPSRPVKRPASTNRDILF